MKHLKGFTAAALALTFTMAACGGGLENATELCAPKEAAPLGYSASSGIDPSLRDAAKEFSAKFTARAMNDKDNPVVSPVSVYLALGLAAECAAGETRTELLHALNTDAATLRAGYSDFYRSVIAEYTTNTGDVSARVDVGNSIWIDNSATAKQDCLDILSNDYLCYAYAADFRTDNKKANAAVRDFVRQQTHDLIDQDFNLSKDTLFTLINALYLKEIWNDRGNDLSMTNSTYDFTTADGKILKTKLLRGYYVSGRAYEGDNFTHFYTTTEHGYKLKFILPKDGHTVREVFTEENLALVNGMTDYRTVDNEKKERYSTRCLFPEFKGEYDEDVKSVLRSLGVEKFFTEACEFKTLTDDPVYCSQVKHVTTLDVNKKGIEGAAVTVEEMAGSSGPGVEQYKLVQTDFVLDRAFGYVLTDRFGTVLFSGIVDKI